MRKAFPTMTQSTEVTDLKINYICQPKIKYLCMSKASVYKVKRQIKQNENYMPLISQRANFLSMQTANKLTRKKPKTQQRNG